MLTTYLATTFANPLVAIGPISYILWHNLWNAWQLFDYERKKAKNKIEEKQ